jgi:hypothetical protein
MPKGRDDLVRIDVAGVVHPVGETARVRLQGRAGTFHVLPAPSHMVVLRQAEGEAGVETRTCLLSGEIRDAGALCDVASFLGVTPHKGELVVIDAGASRSVFVDGGYVVGARSSVASERLGEVLYAHGVLDETKLASSQELAGKQHLRLGEAAVQLGFVDRERLFGLMAVQTQEIFHATLLASSGAFYFLDSFDESELEARHRLSIATLVREGVRRMHETRFFRARIPSPQHVPVAVAQTPQSEPELSPVFAAIDGERSIADIGRALGLGEFEVTRAVFQLVQGGHATIGPPRIRPAAAVEVFNGAIALLLRELDAIDEGDAVRLQLASRVASSAPLTHVLSGAGPSDDGTFDAARVLANLAQIPGAAAARTRAEAALGRLLHEHASYALFLARPHLPRAQGRVAEDSVRSPVSLVVSGMLEPIAPHGPPELPPGARTDTPRGRGGAGEGT